MKPKLIILSDLNGVEKSEWLKEYSKLLQSDFNIKIYDSCVLGGVNTSNVTEHEIHTQFIERGIEIAIKNLLAIETEKVNILAFSIGGTIAWRAALEGLKVDNFYAVSSTRLRYETQKPNCRIRLYYGGDDSYKPSSAWFKKMNIKNKIYVQNDHQMYAMRTFIHKISKEIID